MSLVSPITSENPVKVMVVDDSAVVRGFLTKFVETDECIKVVSSATNGQHAIDNLKRLDVDVIVLDIEMPVMDGLTALPLLLEIDPAVQIIVASTLTEKNATITLKALSSGAVECLAKPTTKELSASDDFKNNLTQKVKALGDVARKAKAKSGVRVEDKKKMAFHDNLKRKENVDLATPKFTLRKNTRIIRPEVIAIGSSTGGPQALNRLFSDLADIKFKVNQPIFITQHMPPTFTAILANNIAKATGYDCREAVDGEVVERGRIYMAKGGLHMLIKNQGLNKVIKLKEDPPENYCRPAVDPMIRSLVEIYGSKVLAIILTGMGSDGQKSCQMLAEEGGNVLAQDEATSVVWGMPGAAATSGVCTNVLPLGLMAAEIKTYAG